MSRKTLAMGSVLFLSLVSCDALWGDFIDLNGESCYNGGTRCAEGHVCNKATLSCEPAVPPVLDAVTPGLGPNLGGIQLQLDGRSFQDGATVQIAGGAATMTAFVSPQRIALTLPPSSSGFGRVPVLVRNPDGMQTSRDDLFAYYASQPFQSRSTSCLTGMAPSAAVIADFNGDQRADLAFASNSAGSVNVLLANGMGGFVPGDLRLVGRQPQSMITADLNGDGKADLVTADSGAGTVTVLLGDGQGKFGSSRFFQVGVAPYSVAAGDANGNEAGPT